MSAAEKEDLKNKAFDIIREEIGNSYFKDITIEKSELLLLEEAGNKFIVLDITSNYVQKILERQAADHRDKENKIYHYIDAKYAIQAIQNGYLRAYPLMKYLNEDSMEYQNGIDLLGINESFEKGGKVYSPLIKEVQERSYILCLSKSPSNEYFWRKSSLENPKVCLELSFHYSVEPHYKRLFEMREVYYDGAVKLTFLDRTKKRIDEHQCKFILSSASQFAMFNKMEKWSPEEEVRFSINGLYNEQSFRFPETGQEMFERGIEYDVDENNSPYLKIKLLENSTKPTRSSFNSKACLASFTIQRVFIDDKLLENDFTTITDSLRKYNHPIDIDYRFGTSPPTPSLNSLRRLYSKF